MKSIDFPDFSSTWKEIIKEKDILIETLEEKLEKCELTISTHIATDNAIIDSIKEFLETNITVKEKKRLLQLLKLIKTNNNQSDTGDCQDEDA